MTATLPASLVPAHLPDFLEGIIVLHGAMRRDVERLPRAIDAVVSAQDGQALERWFAKFAREVEHHHLREDDVVWPMLLDRDPAVGEPLDALVADHLALDAAMAHTAAALATLSDDPSTRHAAAASAEALGDLLRDHLEREEAAVFPVMARVFTAESYAALEDELLKATPKRLIAFELPFAFDGLPAGWVADQLSELPLPIRVLHRWFWQPAYDRLSAPLTAAA